MRVKDHWRELSVIALGVSIQRYIGGMYKNVYYIRTETAGFLTLGMAHCTLSAVVFVIFLVDMMFRPAVITSRIPSRINPLKIGFVAMTGLVVPHLLLFNTAKDIDSELTSALMSSCYLIVLLMENFEVNLGGLTIMTIGEIMAILSLGFSAGSVGDPKVLLEPFVVIASVSVGMYVLRDCLSNQRDSMIIMLFVTLTGTLMSLLWLLCRVPLNDIMYDLRTITPRVFQSILLLGVMHIPLVVIITCTAVMSVDMTDFGTAFMLQFAVTAVIWIERNYTSKVWDRIVGCITGSLLIAIGQIISVQHSFRANTTPEAFLDVL